MTLKEAAATPEGANEMDESGGFIDWMVPDDKPHHARPKTTKNTVDFGHCKVCGRPIERTNPPGMGASFRHTKAGR